MIIERWSNQVMDPDGALYDIVHTDAPLECLPHGACDLADYNDIPRGREYVVPAGWGSRGWGIK